MARARVGRWALVKSQKCSENKKDRKTIRYERHNIYIYIYIYIYVDYHSNTPQLPFLPQQTFPKSPNLSRVPNPITRGIGDKNCFGSSARPQSPLGLAPGWFTPHLGETNSVQLSSPQRIPQTGGGGQGATNFAAPSRCPSFPAH